MSSTGDDRNRLLYRWDLDKTYLRTEFDTVRDVVRTAFEPAARKRTVPGAAALLRELAATGPYGVFILSGSPEQMRRVLEAKLRLDGVRWDSFTLKPSLSNLIRGRFRFLKDQVGYKLGALLASRVNVPIEVDEVLFGDDAEADAFTYSLYADLCAGRIGSDTLVAVLERARVYPEEIPGLVRLAERVPRRDACQRIFIHLDRMSPPEVFDELGKRVCPFYNYLQPALVLLDAGSLPAVSALRVAAELVLEEAFTSDALVASYMDLARRGVIAGRAAAELASAMRSADRGSFATTGAVLHAFVDALELEVHDLAEVPAPEHTVIDYVALFSRDKARARAARRRAMARG